MEHIITDSIINEKLDELNIPYNNETSYHRYNNNNYAVTDRENFFLKIDLSGTGRGVRIEVETAPHLTFGPKPLHPEVFQICNYPCIVTTFIPGQEYSPLNINAETAATVVHQLQEIHNLTSDIYTTPRTLRGALDLAYRRITLAQNLTSQQAKSFTTLIAAYIQPYITKYSQAETLIHSDMLLSNILVTPENKVFIIDYEGIKPSPVEADLAALYQDTYQSGTNLDAYQYFEKAYLDAYPLLNERTLTESILFKNTLATTAAIRLSNKDVLNQRLDALMASLPSKQPPQYMAPVMSRD